MLRILLVLSLSGLAAASPAAEIIATSIDLGAETLMISPVGRLESDFDGDAVWNEIQGASLRLVGTPDCQYAQCWSEPSYAVHPTDSRIAFGFVVDGVVVFRTEQTFACDAADVPIDRTLPFDAPEGADWSFLADSRGTVFVEHVRPNYDCPVGEIPTAVGIDITLTRVDLVVEMQQCLADDATPWGRVKALYR